MKTKTVTIDEKNYPIASLSLGWFRANAAKESEGEKKPTDNIDHMVETIVASQKRAGVEVTSETLLEELDFGSANELFREVMGLSGLKLGEA